MNSPRVVVVGGGPGGAAAAYWLSRNGIPTLMAEKKRYPRDKTCGDGLTPRAIKQLMDMGFDFDVDELHVVTGLRAYAGELTIEIPWPRHTIYPDWGAVMRRRDLDMAVAELAASQGADIRQGTEAHPILEAGRLVGVELRTKDDSGDIHTEVVTPEIVVIADGSLSRFGRALGTHRRRDYPYGMAVRGYYESPNSKDSFLESQLNLTDAQGRTMPGYGWVFPLGDGTINVGAGVISSFKGWKDVNTTKILNAYVDSLPGHWHVTEESLVQKPTGGKLPMSFSVGPKVGRNWVAIGDAAGAVNPFNGEGIDYAYETARLAAEHIADALATGSSSPLHGYAQNLEAEYADYNRVARAFVIAVGNPAVMKTLTRIGVRNKTLMEWTLKVMANLLEPEERGVAEHVYGVIERVVRLGPDPKLAV